MVGSFESNACGCCFWLIDEAAESVDEHDDEHDVDELTEFVDF